MECRECKQILRILKGGMKTEIDTTDIVMVHIYGCFNPDCAEQMKEQSRTNTVVEPFLE